MTPVYKRLVLLGLLLILPSVALGADLKQPANNSATRGGITLQKKVNSTGVLALQEVIAKVLLHNPELQAFSFEIRAREARTLQESLRPNPKLSVTPQDFWGSGDLGGFDRMENTAMLSQVIELGGKRMKRQKAANLNRDLAQWDYETVRMNILTQVAKAYTDALAAQEKRKLAQELVQLSKKSYNAVKARVISGKVSPIHEVKAQVALSATQIEQQQAENNLKAAYRRLASFWGSLDPRFKHVGGSLYLITPVPPFATLVGRMQKNPDLARWATETIHRQAVVTREESKAVPNVTIGAGSRYIQEVQDFAWQVNVTIPLQIFDRNQGGIAEARHRLAKADAEKRSVKLRLQRALSNQYANLINSYKRVVNLKTKILPGARTAFEAVNEGYRFGKFGYLEVLDSQRTWFNARSQFLDALAEYHKAVADVERLTGQAVSPVPEPRPQPREREMQR
jgi:cobalt-zinc-cadmium efflux system outer membrane protein